MTIETGRYIAAENTDEHKDIPNISFHFQALKRIIEQDINKYLITVFYKIQTLSYVIFYSAQNNNESFIIQIKLMYLQAREVWYKTN
jgi:hypothetical protein